MPLSRRSLFALDFSGRPRAAVASLRVHRGAMACRFEVSLPATDAARVDAARKALEEADRVEAMLSPARDTSEVSRLNRHTSPEPLPISPDLFALLQYCARLHAETGGAFDATSAPLGRSRAAARSEGRQPTSAELRAALALVGFDRLQLDAAEGTLRVLTPGTNVGLGAVAKGYAIDRMGQVLRARDVPQALVSAGGSSVLALGGRDKGYLVTVCSDAGSAPLRVWLRDAGLGTSGSGGQFVLVDGHRHGQVVDPRTGQEPRQVRRATVVSVDATTADALSTAFVVGGPSLAASYCAQHPGVLAVLTMTDAPAATQVFGACAGATLALRGEASTH
ncbi:MAG: FAD:protein FMN transferase [Vicinamibacterales bacterium]